MTDDHFKNETAPPFSHQLHPSELATNKGTQFELRPSKAALDAIAADLGLVELRKLRFAGQLQPLDKQDWKLHATFGATIVQECVVTLDPVSTRLDEKIERRWVKKLSQNHSEDADPESDVEMPEDVTEEPLSEVIDLGVVMVEALALALPLYPRAQGAELGEQVFTEPGQAPMTDEHVKPFSGLAALRDKLADGGKDDDPK